VEAVAVTAENEPPTSATKPPSIPTSSSSSPEPVEVASKAVSTATSNDENTSVSGAGRDALATATAGATKLTDGVAELAGRVRHDAARSGGALLDRVEDSLLSASASVDRVRDAVGGARILELTAPVTGSIRALSALPGSAQIDNLLQSEAPPTAGFASPTGVGVSPVPNLPDETQDVVATTPAADRTGMTFVAPGFLLESAATELSRLSFSGDRWDASGRSLLAPANGGYLGGAVQRSGDRVPAEAPAHAPGSTQAAAGSPATTFIPFVALLALLALAAPAIGRRLGEAPRFRAPVPFVCALERPG
jgi:X-X-X-Leu-X-X-Gly heptad repeat protein